MINDKLNLVALIALSVIAAGSLAGMVALEMADKPVPPSLIAIGAACVGSLSGFLNPNRATVRVEAVPTESPTGLQHQTVALSELKPRP